MAHAVSFRKFNLPHILFMFHVTQNITTITALSIANRLVFVVESERF